MKQHEENASKIAQYLESHTGVTEVFYPGLASHRTHAIAKRQFTGFGGLITFRVASEDIAREVLRSTEIFTLAESLGGVESLIEQPATKSHASMLPEQRAKAGITPELIRISVGIEHVDDLIADLGRALERGIATSNNVECAPAEETAA
jgi:cystathionine beta-lyase/cystathionine gamma-synthase